MQLQFFAYFARKTLTEISRRKCRNFETRTLKLKKNQRLQILHSEKISHPPISSESISQANRLNRYFIPGNGLLYFYFYRIPSVYNFSTRYVTASTPPLRSNVFFPRDRLENLNAAVARPDKGASKNFRRSAPRNTSSGRSITDLKNPRRNSAEGKKKEKRKRKERIRSPADYRSLDCAECIHPLSLSPFPF